MKTILICNQKGGVGKTLITDEICWALERDSIIFNVIDLDCQGGLIHDAAKENPDAQVTVVDTPGAMQKDLAEYMKQADLIIIPTLMSSRDMIPLERMIKMAKPYMKKTIFILNRWNRYNITKDFTNWMESKYPECKTAVLSDSTAFNQASARGISIVKYNGSCPGAKQIAQLYGYIKTELKLKEGWR